MGNVLSGLLRDIQHSLRALRRTPSFTIGAVATVALTVGATAAIFSVIYGVLLRQLPYRDAGRVYWIWSDQPGRDRTPFNVPDFLDYRDSIQTLRGFAGFFAYSANLSDEASAERVQGLRATGNFFDVLGAHTQTGRLLEPGDERPESDHVVVLAHGFWTRRFSADPNIVGYPIRLNSEIYTVVGVLSPGFATPYRDVDFVLPFAPDRDPRRGARNSLNFIFAVGRLRDDATAAQASSELNAIARRLQERFPVEHARKRDVRMVALIEGIAGSVRTALLTVFAAVGGVLLIACANLANLMLTRAAGRRREIAVQLALGAARGAVVRRVLVEALLIAVAGGVLGVMAARGGIDAVLAVAPAGLPRLGEVGMDAGVVAFTLAVSSLTGILFGVIPAFASASADVRDALHDGGRGATEGGRRVRGLLVCAEVALAVALLMAMAMLAKSFAKVQAVAPGFDASHVLSARLTLPARRFATRQAIVMFQRELAGRVSSWPEVTSAGTISILPLSGLVVRVPFTVEGRSIERERVPIAQFRVVSAGYFETARIPLKRGGLFSDRDTEQTRPVAVVNEELARQWLSGLEPVGARLLVDDNNDGPRPIEIIGVVGNVEQLALDAGPTWDIYIPYPQMHPDGVGLAAANMFWIARTTVSPMNLAANFAKEVRVLDPEVVASPIRPLMEYLSDSVASRRFSLSLMGAFAVAALLLAVMGIQAVVAYSISQRSREIAIRHALGATRPNIVRLVMGEGIRVIVGGLLAGVLLAVGAMRLLATMLFGVTPTDAATFGEVILVVAAASVLACAVPAYGAAAEVDDVLRAE